MENIDQTPLPSETERPPDIPADDTLVDRVRQGDLAAFELLMRRHNQKLFRAVRSVLRSGDEVEDVMQETYLAAFRCLHQFEGRSRFATWLLRIGINEALARVRRQVRLVDLDEIAEEKTMIRESYGPVRTPEQQAANREVVGIVETALDELPEPYRVVFVLRLVECLDTAEVAEVLGLSDAAVKQRLHRARVM